MKPNVPFLVGPLVVLLALPCTAAAADGEAIAAATTVAAASAVPASACTPIRLTYVQQRVLERADQGVGPLRQYVFNTRSIHMLDLQDTADWVVAHRARAATCVALAAGR
jgi:hypothetical protein